MIKNKTTFQNIVISGLTFFLISCGGGSGGGLPDTDKTAPVVQSISPTNGQLDVEDTITISITFNEDVAKFNSSNIIIKKYIDDVNTTTLVDPILTTDGVNYNSSTKTLTFIPKAGALELNSKYHVLVRNIEDASGNVIADKSWDFETITKPFGDIQPVKDATAVSLSAKIRITFSEAMDLSTLMEVNAQNSAEQNPINFILTEAGTEVPNTDILFSYDAQTNVATYSLRPTASTPDDMKPTTLYTAVLSVNAMDINANSLSSEVTSSFTTGISGGTVVTPPAKPVIISIVASNGNATMSWEKVTGTNITYNIYKSTDSGVTFSASPVNAAPIQASPLDAATISYSHSISIGTAYIFAITAVEGSEESARAFTSEVIQIAPPATPVFDSVTTTTTPASVSAATITWSYVSGLSYDLSVSIGGAGLTTVQNGIDDTIGTVTGTASNQKIKFVHNNITTDVTHQYQVIAVNSQGGVSPAAVSATVTPKLPSQDPINVQAIVGDSEVTVSWQNSDPANQNALKYNVYLSIDNKTTYKKIASNLTGLAHYQRIANNIAYHIAVTSVTSAGKESIKVVANNDTSFLPLTSATQISSDAATCTIRDNGKNQNAGSLWCWGSNSRGQLGIGIKSTKEQPVQVGTVAAGSSAPAQIWDDWISVSVGFGTTCAIRKVNGSGPGLLYCWGDNGRGNLGLGNIASNADTTFPQLVLKPASLAANVTVNWTKVAVGTQSHTCAIHSDTNTVGELFCWGLNWYGQLGNSVGGNTAPNVMQPEPVAGVNSTVTPYKDWLEVSLGDYTTCGIRQESPTKTTVWCWGYGGNGQLGSANLPTSVSIPTQEETLGTDWTSISVASSHGCAVKAKTNSLWCWGSNAYGSLGDGKGNGNSSSATSFVAVQEATLAQDWIKVFARKYNTCGLKTSGQINCWGENDLGQTGNALNRNGNNKPQLSILDNGWREIAIGYKHACGTTLSKNTLCWGSAGTFFLGNVRAESASPVIARLTNGAQLRNVTEIAASKHRVAGGGNQVIASQGTLNKLLGWGNNYSFQITGAAQNLPNYQSITSIDSRSWKKLSTGEGYSCGILSTDDTLWCWGRIDPNNFVTPPKLVPTQIGTDKWRDISITGRQSCGIKLVVDTAGTPLADDQSLWCWGRININGQLGIGNNTVVYTVPTAKVLSPLATQVKWLSVATGNFNTCAITTTNDLYCWGRAVYNLFGISGAGTTDILKPTTAVTVSPAVNWATVKISDYTACATTDTNKLYCWGANFRGEAGATGTQIIPSLVSGGSNSWSNFDIGISHTCGIDAADSSLWCWGDNSDGQLGTRKFGPTPNVTKGTPEKITFGTVTPTWSKVTTGDNYTCATRTDVPTEPNAVWCWGKNTQGELGNSQSWKLKPVLVSIP